MLNSFFAHRKKNRDECCTFCLSSQQKNMSVSYANIRLCHVLYANIYAIDVLPARSHGQHSQIRNSRIHKCVLHGADRWSHKIARLIYFRGARRIGVLLCPAEKWQPLQTNRHPHESQWCFINKSSAHSAPARHILNRHCNLPMAAAGIWKKSNSIRRVFCISTHGGTACMLHTGLSSRPTIAWNETNTCTRWIAAWWLCHRLTNT